MSTSQSLLNALQSLIGAELNYVCLIAQKYDTYYLCLGRHQFYFLNSQLSEVNAEIYYAHLTEILLDNQKQFLIQLELSDGRPENVPKKLVIKTGNIKALIDQIKSCWKTDCLYRMRRVQKFPVIYGKIIRNVNADPFLLKKRQPPIATHPSFGNITIELKGYGFFINQEFVKNEQQVGVFNSMINKESIYVQICDNIQISYINLLKERKNIQFYCEEIAESVVTNKLFWKIRSDCYTKKSNLTMDKAQWLGWEAHYRTNERDIHVILLRRKYIPPMIDSFQDFVVVTYGDPFTTQDEKNVENEKKINKKQQFLPTTKHTIDMCRRIANSIFFKSSINKLYDVAIREKCNALIFDEEGFYFCQNKLLIVPEGMIYTIMYLEKVLKSMSKLNPEKYNYLAEQLVIQYRHIIEEPDRLLENKEMKEESRKKKQNLVKLLRDQDNPGDIIELFVKSGMAQDDSRIIRNWKFKISKYTAYCVNGGLLNGQLTIKDILDLLPNAQQDINLYDTLLKVIDYMLFLTADNVDYSYRRLNEQAQRMNQQMLTSDINYIYNPVIMNELLEQGYIQQELLSAEQPILFPKFLINLLKKNISVDLQVSICRQIIDVIKKALVNNSMTDTIKNAYKQLINPLVELYKAKNKLLASLAGESLFWLSKEQNDVKLVIQQEGGSRLAVEHLAVRDTRLLNHSLKLINSLCYYEPLIEPLLARKLVQYLINIIQGTKVPQTFFDNDIIILTIDIMYLVFNKADVSQQYIFEQNVEYFFNLIITFDNYLLNETTKKHIFDLLNLLIIKFDNVKLKTNKTLIPYIIESFKNKKIKDLELIKSIIHFLLNDLRNNELGQSEFIKDIDIQNIIKDFMKLGDYTLKAKCKALCILHFGISEANLI